MEKITASPMFLIFVIVALAVVYVWGSYGHVIKRIYTELKRKKQELAESNALDLKKVDYLENNTRRLVCEQAQEWLDANPTIKAKLLKLFKDNHAAFAEPGSNTDGLLKFTEISNHRSGSLLKTIVTKSNDEENAIVKARIFFSYTGTYLAIFNHGEVVFNWVDTEEVRRFLPDEWADRVKNDVERMCKAVDALTVSVYSNRIADYSNDSFFANYFLTHYNSDNPTYIVNPTKIGKSLSHRAHTEEEFKLSNYSGLFIVDINDYDEYYDYTFRLAYEDEYGTIELVNSSDVTPLEIPEAHRTIPISKYFHYGQAALMIAEAVSKMPPTPNPA